MEDIMLCDYADDDEIQCMKIIPWTQEKHPEMIKPTRVQKRARIGSSTGMSTSTPPKRIIDLDEDCLLEIFSHIHDLQGLISLCSSK